MKKFVILSTVALVLSACGVHKNKPPNDSTPNYQSDLDPILSDKKCAVRLNRSVVFSSRKLPKGTSEYFSLMIQAQKDGSYVFRARRVTEVKSRHGAPVSHTTFYYNDNGWYEANKALVLQAGVRTIGYVEILQMTPTPIVALNVIDPEYLKNGLPMFVGLSVYSCSLK